MSRPRILVFLWAMLGASLASAQTRFGERGTMLVLGEFQLSSASASDVSDSHDITRMVVSPQFGIVLKRHLMLGTGFEFVRIARDSDYSESTSSRIAILVRPAFYFPINDVGLQLVVSMPTLKFGAGAGGQASGPGYDSTVGEEEVFKFWAIGAFAGLALALGNQSGGVLQFGLACEWGGVWLPPGHDEDVQDSGSRTSSYYLKDSEFGFKTAIGLFF